MKIQLDTDLKIIRLEEKVNLGEFFSKLEELLPDLKWREYELDVVPIINWTSPMVINPVEPYYPTYPWYTTTGGTYNIDIT